MSNELTDVRCSCGDEYPADSYDAGFIAGSGMCQNCDAALPPKDICTCPSGDGSLRHPCPAHPAPVEQAGGDEREAAIAKFAETCPMTAESAAGGKSYDIELRRYYLLGWDDRAALAQPSPASDLDPLNLSPHAEAFNEAPAEALKPEQAEAERPEVVGSAWRNIYNNGFDHVAPFPPAPGGPVVDEPLMTVAQHERIVKAWIERWKAYIELSAKIAAQRDAALARVAELEKQEPVATVAKVPGEDWNGLHFYRDLQGMQPGTKLYAAPVAQAQHSVPDGWRIERSAERIVVMNLNNGADGSSRTQSHPLPLTIPPNRHLRPA
ncbi:hypothetical protein QK383_10335 [Pseudomonas aeruginosa]|nr:hypothetical protein [Pseudomonas aeruginosa]MDI3886152.1 hypothetical protein [Pseudomonas aeruginosa]